MAKLSINLVAHEIVFPGFVAQIVAEDPLDDQSASGSIFIRGQRGQLKLSQDGRLATWAPLAELQPGPHTLVVGELVTRKGERSAALGEVPFFLTDSVARVAPELRVESIVRLQIEKMAVTRLPADRRTSGAFIEIMKASDRRTGAPVELAFDQDGRPIDAAARLAEVAAARAKQLGKLHPSLAARMQGLARPGETVEVAVWFKAQERPQERLRSSKRLAAALPPAVVKERAEIAELTRAMAQRLEADLDVKHWRADALAPVLYVTVTQAQLDRIAAMQEVAGVFLYEREGIEDLDDSIAIANSDDVHSLGFRGAAVRVAVWESGPDDTSNLSIAAFYDPAQTSTSDHARHTHGIIKNVEKNQPKGHAPACRLYSANDKELDALSWAVKDQSCTVISQSFHRSSEPGASGLSYDDIYKDWLALHWPYPIILQAAGNYWDTDPDNIDPPSSEYVNHKGYNSLAVGNHNDSASSMSGSSVFRNPATAHGDRELPEICANGTSVTTVGLTKSGTSMSAPAAAGAAALVQNANSSVKTWPEGCRAILLAGAKRNVVGNTWWQDVLADNDAADGSGAVDALESVRIAQLRRGKNAAATQRGWNAGSLGSGDFDGNGMSTFFYRVKVPSFWFGPRHVKVALAWTSRVAAIDLPFIPEIPISSTLTVDLDLKVFDSGGSQVGYSGSWDNSYEVAEFAGTPGATYTIRIRRWSGTDSTFYGIAWTVTGGLFNANLMVANGTLLDPVRRRA
jgi:Subtilase family